MKRLDIDISDELWQRIEAWRARQDPIPNKTATIRALFEIALLKERQEDNRLSARVEQLEKQVNLMLRAR